jgi:hypothetical protein
MTSHCAPVLALLLLAACSSNSPAGAGGAAGSTTSGGGGEGGAFVFFDGGSTGATPDAACVAEDAGADAATGCEGIAPGVGYVADVEPILATCSGELCHQPPTREWLLGTIAKDCCDARPLVAPGDAAKSYLMSKLTGDGLCSGGTMPFGAEPLPDAQILVIRRWICEGAPGN